MSMKWQSKRSTEREIPVGEPQWASLGLIEYDFQSNDNTNFLSDDDTYKFVDYFSVLEILNLIKVGLTSYNFKNHVASDIGIDQLFLTSENINSQTYMDNICDWTNQKLWNSMKSKVNSWL